MVIIGDHLFKLGRCVRVFLCPILDRLFIRLDGAGWKINLSPFMSLYFELNHDTKQGAK